MICLVHCKGCEPGHVSSHAGFEFRQDSNGWVDAATVGAASVLLQQRKSCSRVEVAARRPHAADQVRETRWIDAQDGIDRQMSASSMITSTIHVVHLTMVNQANCGSVHL